MLSAFFQKKISLSSSENNLLKRFDRVVERSRPLAKKLLNGKKEYIQKNNLVEQIAEDAKSTYPLVHENVKKIIKEFIAFKKIYGSPIEQKFYEQMNEQKFFQRLLTNRPVAFLNKGDDYLLSNGEEGSGGFTAIGTMEEKLPLVLKNYLSYGEMKISALVALSGPTCFMNKGDQNNLGEVDDKNIEKRGVMMAVVGPREELPGVMEFQDTVISPEQNTLANGYGEKADPNNVKTKELRMWAHFYGEAYYPTFAEAKEDKRGAYVKFNYLGKKELEYYLNVAVYKARIRLSLLPYLLDANKRAEEQKKSAYVQVPGIGLGVWNINRRSPLLADLMIEVCREILDEYQLKNISDLNFSYFANYDDQAENPVKNLTLPGGGQEYKSAGGHLVKIHYSKRNVADPLPQADQGKLLVVGFAWDGNAKIGNELWWEILDGSMDPATVCCCSICFTQDPDVNPDNVNGSKVVFYGKNALVRTEEKEEEKESKNHYIRENIYVACEKRGQLMVSFSNKEDYDYYAKKMGQAEIIPQQFRKGPQFLYNQEGESFVKAPIKYRLYFVTFKTDRDKIAIKFKTKEARDELIKLFALSPDLTYASGKVVLRNDHVKKVYCGNDSSFFKMTAFSGQGTDHSQDNLLYFPAQHAIFKDDKIRLTINPHGVTELTTYAIK